MTFRFFSVGMLNRCLLPHLESCLEIKGWKIGLIAWMSEDGYFGELLFRVAVMVCLCLPEDTDNGGCGVFLPRAAAVVLLPRCHRQLRTHPGHEQELCLLGCICHISPCVGCCSCSEDPAGTRAAGPELLVWCEDGRCRADMAQKSCAWAWCAPHHVPPGITRAVRAPSVLWGGAGLQKFLLLQWHTHRNGIHPAHGLFMLLFPTCRRTNSVFLFHSIFQMYGLILQRLSLIRGVNEQVSLFLGERGQGETPLLLVLSFPPKNGDEGPFHPSGFARSLQWCSAHRAWCFSAARYRLALDDPWGYQTFVLDGLNCLWSLSSPMPSLGHFWENV